MQIEKPWASGFRPCLASEYTSPRQLDSLPSQNPGCDRCLSMKISSKSVGLPSIRYQNGMQNPLIRKISQIHTGARSRDMLAFAGYLRRATKHAPIRSYDSMFEVIAVLMHFLGPDGTMDFEAFLSADLSVFPDYPAIPSTLAHKDAGFVIQTLVFQAFGRAIHAQLENLERNSGVVVWPFNKTHSLKVLYEILNLGLSNMDLPVASQITLTRFIRDLAIVLDPRVTVWFDLLIDNLPDTGDDMRGVWIDSGLTGIRALSH